MSTKLSKDDVKNPDQVLKTLTQGFEWSQNHSRALVVGLIAFIAIGIGWVLMNNMSEKKETQAQETYFHFEKNYLDKKRGFEEAERALCLAICGDIPDVIDFEQLAKESKRGVLEHAISIARERNSA